VFEIAKCSQYPFAPPRLLIVFPLQSHHKGAAVERIIIKTGAVKINAEIFDTPAGKKIAEALPFKSTVSRWGDEIYFSIPVSMEKEPGAREEVAVGTLGFWPVGNAFCIFFGPTPVSKGEKPRAYSPVNVFGKVTSDTAVLKKAQDGEEISVTKA